MRQIFYRNCASGAFSNLNYLFADSVILSALKISLLACYLFQLARRGAGAFTLQVAPPMRESTANLINLFAATYRRVRVRQDVDDAEIHSYHIIRIDRRRGFNFTHRVQVIVALAQYKINFTLPKWQQLALVVTALKRNCLASGNCPDVHRFVFREANNSIVVGNRTVSFERAKAFVIQLVSVSNFRDAAHNHLRRQVKLRLCFVVRQFMQSELFKRWFRRRLPALRANPVAGFVCTLKRLAQGFSLRRRWLQLEIDDQLHAAILPQLVKYGELKRTVKSLFAVAAFSSPCINAGVSKRESR